MAKVANFRKYLSIEGLLGAVRKSFQKVPDETVSNGKKKKISLVDCLMSGLAVFGLKYPSLLKFDNEKNEPKSLFKVFKMY